MTINNCINDPINIQYKNMIIGGDFDTNPWQRGISFVSVATGQVTADRFKYWKNGSMMHSLSQVNDAPTLNQCGLNAVSSLQLNCTTAKNSLANSDFIYISQAIEGSTFSPFAGKQMTLSFWTKCSLAGNYSAFVQRGDGAYSVVLPFSIQSPNTWKKIVLNIPSTSIGGWNLSNGIGILVGICLASGSTYQTNTTNSWIAGNYYSYLTQINGVQTTGINFQFTLMQLEVGNYPSLFECKPDEEVLLQCQRYFQKTFQQDITPIKAIGSVVGSFMMPSFGGGVATLGQLQLGVTMRTAPSVTLYNPKNNNSNAYNSNSNSDCSTTYVVNTSDRSIVLSTTAPASTGYGNSLWIHTTMNSEI